MRFPRIRKPRSRDAVIGAPFLWLALFFLLPFVIVVKISFAEADVAIPPYTDVVSWADNQLTIQPRQLVAVRIEAGSSPSVAERLQCAGL